MKKDKYDFISEILQTKSLDAVQRERILLLAKEELKKDGHLLKDLDQRIKRLEEINVGEISDISTNSGRTQNNGQAESKINLKPYLDPSGLYNYLYDYNIDPILKSTCHEIDSDDLANICNYCNTSVYDFEVHLSKVIEAFEIHDKKFAPYGTKALIRAYLTGKNYKGNEQGNWSSGKIKYNWSSAELKEWCRQHPGLPPHPNAGYRRQVRNPGFEFNEEVWVQNKRLQKFSDLVIHFKYLFHVKREHSLKDIISSENDLNKSWNEKILWVNDDHIFPKNIEFFTDVDKLVQAYRKLINLIIEVNDKNNSIDKARIKLSLEEKQDVIQFSILHVDSVYGKTLINTCQRLGNTYSSIIENQINGLANFYVEADFDNDGPYRIGIWDRPGLWRSNNFPEPVRLNEKVGGVKHVLAIVKAIEAK